MTGTFDEPPTSLQLMGLRELRYLSEVQDSALGTALVPLRQAPKGLVALVLRLRKRLLYFALNGLLVFLTGLAIQLALIRYAGMGHVLSYVIQTVLSVQLSFVLSRFLTWGDRRVSFFGALTRFNAQQLATTGAGMVIYAGLQKFGMNYIAANVAVTAVLTPVSFTLSHNWSMGERTGIRARLAALPWPLFAILAVQVLLSLRLIWTNTAYTDEALYIYSGGQELDHWLHGSIVEDYQEFFSGSPVVYPPLAAIANAVGGLAGARLLSLGFMLGVTALLYATACRLFGKWAAVLGAALFASLGVTQFLSALSTYDPMGLFLLALATYLVTGRGKDYDTLSDVAYSTVVAGGVLALANADKYATALWDPVVIAIAWCAPMVAGQSWRYGLGRALRFTATLAAFITIGLAIGKAKYVQGILTTTVNRSKSQIGMGQSPSLVLHDTWIWVGAVVVIAVIGVVLLILLPGRSVPITLLAVVLLLATVLAPINQARIGTTVSLHKHVDFGAWFGCIVAGCAIARLLRYRVVMGAAASAILLVASLFYTAQASTLYQTWSDESPEFIAALRPMLQPGPNSYLIEGHSAIAAYYVGPAIHSLEWKDALNYSYTDPRTNVTYNGNTAFADAIKNRAFTLIIVDFSEKSDDAIAADIWKYGGYKFAGHLPPSTYGSQNFYTVWRVLGSR